MSVEGHRLDKAHHAVLPWPFDRPADGGYLSTTSEGSSTASPQTEATFLQYHEDFESLLGDSCSFELVAEYDWPWAHEAGIYVPERNSIFVTSNILQDTTANNGDAGELKIVVSEIALDNFDIRHYTQRDIPIRMANGGVNYKGGLLLCEQGYKTECPSSLLHVTFEPENEISACPLINNFHGRAFNSLNDVVVHGLSGTIWFTDPDYGHEQAFKPNPQLPCQAYCFNPATGQIKVVANGIPKCNGIAFSPDFQTCYITDTSYISGNGHKDPQKGGWIYAFDVRYEGDGPRNPSALQNKRVFAFTDAGAPDGIKCDTQGNVYSGCFDGVHVWNRHGDLLGKMLLPNGDGCANLVFAPEGTLYILSECRLYRVKLAVEGVRLWE